MNEPSARRAKHTAPDQSQAPWDQMITNGPPAAFPPSAGTVPIGVPPSSPDPRARRNRGGRDNSRRFRLIGAGLVILLVVVGFVAWKVTRPAPDNRPPVTTQLGVFRGTDPQAVGEFSSWLGRDVNYAVDFSGRSTWQDIAEPQQLIDTWKGQPYRMVYSLAMLPDEQADTIARGATGEYDKYYADLAQRLVAAGQQNVILRLGWEFNLVDSRWSTDDSASFIKYWRQIVTTMRAQPGQQFQFDWNPNNGDSKYDAANYYPGSDVVDYIGIDSYDTSWADGAYPYPANCDSSCRTKRQKVAWNKSVYGGDRGLKFWSKFAREHGKPMSLPEWGLWQRNDQHGGGDDPDFLRRMNDFIADPSNRVAYQSYFEFDGSDGTHRLMTTFPKDGQLFRSLLATSTAKAS